MCFVTSIFAHILRLMIKISSTFVFEIHNKKHLSTPKTGAKIMEYMTKAKQHSVQSKPIDYLETNNAMMSRWTPTKHDRFIAKRWSRLPCNPRGSPLCCMCFVADAIINLAFTRCSARDNCTKIQRILIKGELPLAIIFHADLGDKTNHLIPGSF